jgi:hypothetical protein
MAAEEQNVAVAVTGAISVGETTAAAPTGTAGTLTGFTDLGYVGEDGVTESNPATGEAQRIKAWQNGATVRTIRAASEDNPTWTFVMIETKKETVETYYGTVVTQTATEGSFVIDSQALRGRKSYVIDVIDGAELERVYIPQGEVVEVGDKVYANGEVIGYEVTIEGHRDATLGGNAKVWSTRLKT